MGAARLIPELLELAHSAKDTTALCDVTLDRLQTLLPWDGAIVASLPYSAERVLVRHPDVGSLREAFRFYVENQSRMHRELQRVRAAERASRGAIIDSLVFTDDERAQSVFHTEVARPLRIVNILSARVTFRGRALARMILMRLGRSPGFVVEDIDRIVPLLPALGLAYGALDAQEKHELAAALTAREHQIAELVASGYRNHEIAVALGTSRNTVRNQLATLFEKLSVSNRAELVAVLARSR